MELLKTIPAYFMAILLVLLLLRFRYNNIIVKWFEICQDDIS